MGIFVHNSPVPQPSAEFTITNDDIVTVMLTGTLFGDQRVHRHADRYYAGAFRYCQMCSTGITWWKPCPVQTLRISRA